MTFTELKQWASKYDKSEIIIYNDSIELDFGGFSLTLKYDGSIKASDGFIIVENRTPKQMQKLMEVLLND